jgi:hypothetical protein
MNHHLTNITSEQRQQMLAQAKISRQAKKDASGNIISFKDETYWRETSSQLGVRMPPSVAQSNEFKWLKRAAKKLDIDVNTWVKEVCGCTSLTELAKLNPNAGAVGLMGLFIEHVIEEKSK